MSETNPNEPVEYAAAEGGAMALTAKPPTTRKRRTSLASRGEPMVWLTGGCVALAVLMIATLLGYVALQGFATFWPSPLERVTLADGAVILGEPTRDETFLYNEDADGDGELGPYEDVDGDNALDRRLPIDRTLYQTGNYPISDDSFRWVRHDKKVEVDRPGGALTVEWREKGKLFGDLVAVTRETEGGVERTSVEADGFDATLAKLRDYHGRTEALNHEIEVIEEGPQDEIQVARTKLARELNEAEYAHGPDSPQAREVAREIEEREKELGERSAELNAERRRLVEARDAFRLEVAAADGTIIPEGRGASEPVRVAQINRVYAPNQLALSDKLGLYFGRWWEFLSEPPRQSGSQGGMFPAILGTVMLTFLMVLLVVPLGVIAAIYLREYATQGPLTSLVRISVNNLAGVPSIVYGVFGLGFFCYTLGGWIDGGPANIGARGVEPLAPVTWGLLLGLTVLLLASAVGLGVVSRRVGRSDKVEAGGWATRLIGLGLVVTWASAVGLVALLLLRVPFFDGLTPALAASGSPVLKKPALLWASLTLALLTLPVVIVATEEAISAVPKSMREGAYACGASKWQTIRKIVLPRALPGIMTGTILAIARGAGEVAPIMLVGALFVGGEDPIDLSDNPVTGVDGWFGFNRSFQHLGYNIYHLGFQSPDSEAARPLLYTTVLLLIAIVVVLNVTAILIRNRLRRAYAGGAF